MVDVKLHIVGVKSTLVICRGKLLGVNVWELGGSRIRAYRLMLLLLGVGNRAALLTKLVDNDDVILFKVLDESMEIIDLETTASVIATQLVLAVEYAYGIDNGTVVTLERRGHLSAPKVARVKGAKELPWGASRIETTAKRARAPRYGGSNDVGGGDGPRGGSIRVWEEVKVCGIRGVACNRLSSRRHGRVGVQMRLQGL